MWGHAESRSLSPFKKYNVEMPIVEQVYKVLHEDKSPAEAVNDLMNRALKAEF